MSEREKKSVLLVDDNEPTCTLMAAILQADFTCDTASDGREAIERLRTRRYAAVLLDLRMPLHDGYEVLDYLQANDPAALRRVLIVTAALSDSELSRAGAYGVCGIIRKPFDVDRLLADVKNCVAPNERALSDVFCATPVLLLLADLLQRRLL